MEGENGDHCAVVERSVLKKSEKKCFLLAYQRLTAGQRPPI